MKQKLDDITLEAGANSLDVQMVPIMECTPGEEECREADLYVCSNKGLWELKEEDSPQCLTPLGRVLAGIEAGTWTGTLEQLAEFEAEVGRGTEYDAAVDAAYDKIAADAESAEAETGEDMTVAWSSEKGYYTIPTEEIPWDNWVAWEDAPWDNWYDVPWNDWDDWDDWDEAPWDNWPNWNDYWNDAWDDAPWDDWAELPWDDWPNWYNWDNFWPDYWDDGGY